jgi:processive 1,2-diacylglycerol beta-glucosyltransferase
LKAAGNGHRRAAEALAAAARTDGHPVVLRDVLDFTPPLYRTTYAQGYLRLVRSAPELWGYLYSRSDRLAHRPFERRLRTVFNRLNTTSFWKFFNRESPDAVLCTHFLPLELIATQPQCKNRGFSLHGIVTDFAVHALWFTPGVDAYFVATEEARRQLIRQGQPASRIVHSGIPILPAFAPSPSPEAARRRLGLDPHLPLVLLLSGGCGVGPTVELIRTLVEDPPPGQWVVIAGRNPALETAARRAVQGATLPLTILGYTPAMHDYMDAANLIVSKPGGLTCAESLAKGKPLLIVDPIPGQEQRNCEYLLENGCAARLFDPPDAAWKIRALLADPDRLAALSANAAQHGHPHAAAAIVRAVAAGFPSLPTPESRRGRATV